MFGRRRWLALLVSLSAVAWVIPAAGPAQAYNRDELARSARYAVVHTDTCLSWGFDLGVTGSSSSAYCFIRDSADSTYFYKDAGGQALKVEVRLASGALVGKVEFHPLGEELWIYDLRNDNDTFYVEASGDGSTDCGWDLGTYRSPELGHKVVQLGNGGNLREGCRLHITLFDSAELMPDGYHGSRDFFDINSAVA